MKYVEPSALPIESTPEHQRKEPDHESGLFCASQSDSQTVPTSDCITANLRRALRAIKKATSLDTKSPLLYNGAAENDPPLV